MYVYKADQGKVWKNKKTGELSDKPLVVARKGTVKQYEQVSKSGSGKAASLSGEAGNKS